MRAAVVIPVYKESLHLLEKVSLIQAYKIFGRYHDIILIFPSGLNMESYTSSFPGCKIEKFSPDFFQGISGYNKLMLSIDFYARFSDYNYILIYQLDAFVFRDELDQWCNMGYDYIGSPWIYDDFVKSYNGKHAPIWSISHWKKSINYGGNGGFSLRKVKSYLKFLSVLSNVAKNYKGNEDGFWSMVAVWYNPFFKVAPPEVALRFAFERLPEKSYEKVGYRLPFGCHAWHKYNFEFWKPYIQSFNHELDAKS